MAKQFMQKLTSIHYLAVVICVLAGVYVVQIQSPLRIGGDAKAYLTMARTRAEGSGLYAKNEDSHFPPGYPFLLSLLVRLGLGSSAQIVSLNLLMLCIGLCMSYQITREVYECSRAEGLGLITLLLLSYLYYQYVTRPYSEMTFLAASMLCLWAASRTFKSEGARRWAYFAVSTGSFLAAFLTRTVGFVLLPALLWGLIGRFSVICRVRHIWKRFRLARIGTVGLLAATGLIFLFVISRTTYFQEMVSRYTEQGIFHMLSTTLGFRLTEWGQLITNCPYTHLPAFAQKLLPFFGVAAISATINGLWHRKHFSCTDVYVVTYLCVLLFWPYWDARFWLPIMPVAGVLIYRGITQLMSNRIIRLLGSTYIVIFALIGLIGLGYNTRISLSGEQFPKYYDYPGLNETYEVAWGKKDATSADNLNERALRLLRKYEPYAKE